MRPPTSCAVRPASGHPVTNGKKRRVVTVTTHKGHRITGVDHGYVTNHGRPCRNVGHQFIAIKAIRTVTPGGTS